MDMRRSPASEQVTRTDSDMAARYFVHLSSHAATEGSRHSSVCASSAPIDVREDENVVVDD